MDTIEEELNVDNSTASFVLPLGAAINMGGNAIYYELVAVFFAQVFNVDLSFAAYAPLFLPLRLAKLACLVLHF